LAMSFLAALRAFDRDFDRNPSSTGRPFPRSARSGS